MKNFLIGVAIIILGAAVGGGYIYPQIQAPTVGTTSGTSATQRIAEWSFNPATGATTSSSVVNGDGQDRVITDTIVACSGVGTSQTPLTGAGLAQLTFQVATTSTATPVSLGSNTNFVFNQTIATSSATFYNASTTPGATSASLVDAARRWANGTYLTVSSNATNTAACTITVKYLQGLGI